MHQAVAGSKEERGEVSGLPANRTQHLALIDVAEDARCRKCGLGKESTFHILCECNALAGIRQRVLGQVYLDTANIREACQTFAKVQVFCERGTEVQ